MSRGRQSAGEPRAPPRLRHSPRERPVSVVPDEPVAQSVQACLGTRSGAVTKDTEPDEGCDQLRKGDPIRMPIVQRTPRLSSDASRHSSVTGTGWATHAGAMRWCCGTARLTDARFSQCRGQPAETRRTTLPRVCRSASCAYASRTCASGKLAAIGTVSSPASISLTSSVSAPAGVTL